MEDRRKPIISAISLYKEFDVGENKIPVLKKINLDIYTGEFVIIFGPSGCGKSTFLNTILGLEPPTSGKIFIKGNDLFAQNADNRAEFRHDKFGVIYQQPLWLKSLNVIENVALPLNMDGMSRKKAKEKAMHFLKLLKMDTFADYTPTELSGGQQQKVSFCRSLVSNPWILLADEPTGNLDSTSANEVMNMFKYINDESKRTVVMVSHNENYEKYATKVVRMHDGDVYDVKEKKKVNVPEKESMQDILKIAGM
jgi:putative ABC transport system ATP-binding protein